MVAYYVERIHNKEITLDKVPPLWRKKVKEILENE